jgi:type IX secretion system PorP/SprF family membrane protein
MKNTIVLIATMILLSVGISHAQSFTPSMLNYSQQELFINPAYAGSQGAFSGSAIVQSQLVKFPENPNTQRFQMHFPAVNDKIGLGLNFQHESYAITHNYNFGINYAYRIKMSKGTLSLGIQAGFASSQVNYANLDTPQENDPMFSENKSMGGFSVGIGGYYTNDSTFYLGFSIPKLIDNSLSDNGAELNNKLDFDKMPFYITGGYLFTLGQSFRLKPAALLAYSADYKFAYNIGLTGYYMDKYWLGTFARYNSELGANIGFNILDYVNINYMISFSYGSTLSKAGHGVIHEVGLNVLLGKKADGKSLFRYF